MKKIALIFVSVFALLNTNIFAYDFNSCQEKAKTHFEKIGDSYGVAIKSLNPASKKPSKAVLFYYGKKAPQGYKVLKSDLFLGMHLLESKKNLTPITIRSIESKILEEEIASLTPASLVSGKIQTRMQSPRKYATLNVPTFKNSLLITLCEQFYGIGIGDGKFIEKKYLDRFLNAKEIYYGDLGIRVFDNANNEVEVKLIDPFFPNMPFKYGDIILKIGQEAILNSDIYDRVVFDLPEGKKVPITIKRNGAILEVEALVENHRGGMNLAENFFSRVGIGLDSNFTITYVSQNAKNGFERLKIGDKILRINQKETPKGYANIIRFLGDFANQEQNWLISRDDFQFFIKINKKVE